MANKPKFMKVNSLPTFKTWILIVEDFIVSNYPNTPSCQDHYFHVEQNFQFILYIFKGFMNRQVSSSLRANKVPTSSSKGTSPE